MDCFLQVDGNATFHGLAGYGTDFENAAFALCDILATVLLNCTLARKQWFE